MLEVEGLSVFHGSVRALDGVSLEVRQGELVALVGSNGAGKSTLLRTLSGLHAPGAGSIRYMGRDIAALRPPRRVEAGIAHVPEGRRVFAPLTVEDNLMLGAYSRKEKRDRLAQELEQVYALFPILRDKRSLAAGTLSGGQQQMLAIGRALMGKPRLLLLDEPSMGLAPLLIAEVFNVVRRLQKQGMTILIVEQNATAALELADYGYVLEAGRVTRAGEGFALCNDEEVRRAYLGA
ncbi:MULTISPECIES: ABC transporter ATP-binding protein [Thauera]|uniref:ABC transporter ATP-binding protein n=1 Tax=Thauera sinica TaxID=2665146 RepID=A0ABW1AP62_9RHOO